MSAPVVHWSAGPAERTGTPLIAALHGRGSDEHSLAGLTPYLPPGVTVAAVRAPIPEGRGYAWFANRGIGRPQAESIASTAKSLFDWLDTVQAQHSAVMLLGFSGGMAMAGGLLMAQPQRFAAAVLLSGTLPWDAELPEEAGRLSGIPVFWGRDVADTVIPGDLVQRTGAWLREKSGADLHERRYSGLGHSISTEELDDIRGFLADAMTSSARE